MGAFLIFDVGFKTIIDRKKFEKKYKINPNRQILVDENSNSRGFAAWTLLRSPSIEVIYFMGFMGYAEPQEILKECLKEGIKINFLSYLSINDRDSTWTKIRGRW